MSPDQLSDPYKKAASALDRGDLVASGTGRANGETVTVDGSLLTGPQVHKLVVLGFSNDDCSAAQKGEMAAVFAVPLKVN